MKNIFTTILTCLFFYGIGTAQDTFSIMAVDPATGEVGSAGATCLTSADCGGCGGAVIINNLVPGVGGINAQAYVCIPNSNLNKGIIEMQMGKSPQEILDFLIANDFCASQSNNPAYRQYGIVDLDENNIPRAVAFSGANTSNYSNHITGSNYAIQGNILLGQEILDDMEAGFLNTEGTLAEKLMGAMQGANVPGADTRCLIDGISSKSGYLRVAQPNDEAGDFYLDLIVESTVNGVDPIDSLQSLMNTWLLTNTNELNLQSNFSIFPNPSNGKFSIEIQNFQQYNNLTISIFTTTGKLVKTQVLTDQLNSVDLSENLNKLFIYHIMTDDSTILDKGKLVVRR